MPTATPLGPPRPRHWLAIIALVLGSCARTPPPVAPIAPAPEPPAAENPVDLQLLEAGAEPRAPLRYRIAAGQSETLVIDLAAQLKLAIGDMSPPQLRRPTVRLTMAVVARTVEPRLTLEGKVVRLELPEDPAIPAGMATAVRADLERMVGLTWTAIFTDRGAVQRVHLLAPADANTQLLATLDHLREAIRLLLPPLPEPPVGKNARWQVRRPTAAGWIKAEETATFKLGEAREARRPLLVLLSLSSGEQQLTGPGVLPGANLALSSFEGKGSGQIELELGKIVQPGAMGWSGSGKGVGHPAGEPPAPMTLTIDSSINVRRP